MGGGGDAIFISLPLLSGTPGRLAHSPHSYFSSWELPASDFVADLVWKATCARREEAGRKSMGLE